MAHPHCPLLPGFATLAVLAALLVPLLPARAHALEAAVSLLEVDVPAGDRAAVGIVFDLPPGTHIYWRNPGEAGLPPSVEVQAEGFTLDDDSPLFFPPPVAFDFAGVRSFGYADTATLVVRLRRAGDAEPLTEPAGVTLEVDYLICDDMRCVPARATLRGRLVPAEAGGAMMSPAVRDVLAAANPPAPVRATQAVQARRLPDGSLAAEVRLPADAEAVGFFPHDADALAELRETDGHAFRGVAEVTHLGDGRWQISAPDLLPEVAGAATFTGGVVAFDHGGARRQVAVLIGSPAD